MASPNASTPGHRHDPRAVPDADQDGAPNANIEAGDEITYTLFITHTPQSTVTAYDLDFQDVIPNAFTYKDGSLQAPGA